MCLARLYHDKKPAKKGWKVFYQNPEKGLQGFFIPTRVLPVDKELNEIYFRPVYAIRGKQQCCKETSESYPYGFHIYHTLKAIRRLARNSFKCRESNEYVVCPITIIEPIAVGNDGSGFTTPGHNDPETNFLVTVARKMTINAPVYRIINSKLVTYRRSSHV